MTKWINIYKKIPAIGEVVLFCGIGEIFIPVNVGMFGGNKNLHRFILWSNITKKIEEGVTHWMPFPELPCFSGNHD